MITTEKVSAAYAVQTTRDELANVFRKLEDEAVKEQIENIREISELLIGAMGGSHARINLGDEPVILAAEQLSPNELLEMNKSSLLAIVMHQGSIISHVSIMAKSMGSAYTGGSGDTEGVGRPYGLWMDIQELCILIRNRNF